MGTFRISDRTKNFFLKVITTHGPVYTENVKIEEKNSNVNECKGSNSNLKEIATSGTNVQRRSKSGKSLGT